MGSRVPLRAQYADAKDAGMGGEVMLYLTRGTNLATTPQTEDAANTTEEHAIQNSMFADAVANLVVNSSSEEETEFAHENAERSIARTWMNDFWNISVSMGGEYHMVHGALYYDSAGAAAVFFDAYLPGVSDFAKHSIRMYANALRAVIIGVAYTGNQVTQGKHLEKSTLWGLMEPVIEEQMASAHSVYEVVHMFMYGPVSAVHAYNDKTTRIVCDKSDIQNNVMRETLKIVHAVSGYAQFPNPLDGSSVGCNPLSADCAAGAYEIDTSLNLNPVCGITYMLNSPRTMGTNIQTVFEQQQTVLKKLFGKATPTALSELIAEYDVQSKPTTVLKQAVTKHMLLTDATASDVRGLRTSLELLVNFVVDVSNCMTDLFNMGVGQTQEGRDCERVIDDLLWPTAIVNSIMVITFEAQVRIF
ncbi:hypothetical protein CYMTET_41440 [Cymbomonas tetramitiformis]|uniref:Uncharacterized protein n=1 Tax=Cymbomonas tetramitiformis TaxID=36881 RepID=A0AAE0F3L3_9CHLO|nr:hypothetical protein CYMTET_41440 [Cymbomonas tetramitiformis]